MKHKRGFTLIELLVVVAIIALLIGLLLPALAKAQRNAKSLKDQTQIREMHQSMVIFAENNMNRLPTPGLINRLTDPYTGLDMPGRGPEDVAINDTGPMFSSMIAQEFFNPDICIGPTEVSDLIFEDLDYNYSSYSPANDSFWDDEFLGDVSQESNTSYFHMAICGRRKRVQWRNTQSGQHIMLATRAPKDGQPTGTDHENSITLELHGPDREWQGNIVFGDNSTDSINNFFPATSTYQFLDEINYANDNIYAAEFDDYGTPEAGNDNWCVASAGGTTDSSCNPVYDPLIF